MRSGRLHEPAGAIDAGPIVRFTMSLQMACLEQHPRAGLRRHMPTAWHRVCRLPSLPEKTNAEDDEVVAFRDSSGGKKLMRNGAGNVLGPLRKGAREATDQVKQTAAEVTRVITDTIQDEASRLFHDQRGRVAKRVERLGRVARQAAHALHAVKMDAVAD